MSEKVFEDVASLYKIDETNIFINNDKDIQKYFENLEYYLENFIKLHSNLEDNFTNMSLITFGKIILNTVKSLKWKYKVITELHELSVSPKQSGFPHFYEILDIESNTKNSLKELSSIPSLKDISKRFVIEVLTKEMNSIFLKQLYSKRKYYEILEEQQTLKSFSVLLGKSNEGKTNYFSWYLYDSSTNVPLLYVLKYETEDHEENQIKFKREIEEHLKTTSNSNLTLYTIIKSIDETFEDIHPKELSRFTIGPIYIEGITKNSSSIKNIIKDRENKENALFSWTEEIIYSYDEKVENGFFKSTKKQLFYIDDLNPEYAQAGVSNIRRSTLVTYNNYQRYNANKEPNDILDNSKNHIISIDQNIY